MRCYSSKFLLISIMTFLVGVGIAQVWQSFNHLGKLNPALPETEPIQQIVENGAPFIKKRQEKIDFCKEIEKDPSYPNAAPSNFLTVSAGILNHRACPPFPYPTIRKNPGIYGRDYLNVQVTVDENGFVINASAISNQQISREFAVRIEELVKKLRIQPLIEEGTHLKSTGVLIVYLEHDIDALPKN
jgi:hypothetical protein